MGLNLSNQQIARELDLNKDDVQRMTKQLRQGVVVNTPEPVLSSEVECNVQQVTIEPVIRTVVAEGTRFFTDEYDIYHRVSNWGYEHRTVCHSRGEYARDDDGDGLRFMSTPSKGCGPCCAPGCVPIGGSLKRAYRYIWAFSSLFTTPACAVRACSSHSWACSYSS